MSTVTDFEMQKQIEKANTILDQCFGQLGYENQSLEQIFGHCQEVKAFVIFSLYKHGLRKRSDKHIGNGLLIGRYENKWTSPILINIFHPSLHPSKFFEQLSDKYSTQNQNIDVLNYLLVLKDQRMIDYFIQTQDIILGKDYQILSTTNASKLSSIPDALLLYNLIPSRGLELICHLSNFYDMKMELDADNTNQFYSDNKDFSLAKILYGQCDMKLDENFQTLLKVIDDRFLFSNRDQDSLMSKIMDKTKEGIDIVKNQINFAADTVKSKLPSIQSETTESRPIEKILNDTAPQIDEMNKKSATGGEVFREAKYKNKELINDQMLPAQKEKFHDQPFSTTQQINDKKNEGSNLSSTDENNTQPPGTAGLKATMTNITNTIGDKTKQLLGKNEQDKDIEKEIFEANSKESKDKWMKAANEQKSKYKNKEILNDQMIPRKNDTQSDVPSSSQMSSSIKEDNDINDINDKTQKNVERSEDLNGGSGGGMLENLKEKLTNFFDDNNNKDTIKVVNKENFNEIMPQKNDSHYKKPPTSLGPSIAIPPASTNTFERSSYSKSQDQ